MNDDQLAEELESMDIRGRHYGAAAGAVLGGGWGALAGYFVGRELE